MLRTGLEDRTVIFSRLVDLLQLVQSQKPTQVVGVGPVAYASVSADEIIFPRVAYHRAVDVGVRVRAAQRDKELASIANIVSEASTDATCGIIFDSAVENCSSTW